MAKPTEPIPTWATNANYLAGVEEGTPTKVAPSSPQRADGWRPGERPPAQHENYERNAIGVWIDYFDDVIDGNRDTDGTTRIITIAAADLIRAVDTQWTVDTVGGKVTATTANARLNCDLNRILTSGQIITRIRMLVKPVAIEAGANRSRLLLTRLAHDFVTPAAPTQTTVFSVTDAGSTATQMVSSAVIAETVNRETKSLWLEIKATNTGVGDLVYAVEIQVTDRGPRNF